MSELKQALDAINRVDFNVLKPSEATRIGGFLERAALEITQREDAVSQRERDASKREAAVSLREETVQAQLKTLASVQSVRRVLDHKSMSEVKRAGWFGKRA